MVSRILTNCIFKMIAIRTSEPIGYNNNPFQIASFENVAQLGYESRIQVEKSCDSFFYLFRC